MQGIMRLGLGQILLAVLASAASAPAATFVVTRETDGADGKCDGDCSLREAIRAANLLPGHDTIILPAGTFILSVTGQDEHSALQGDLDFTDEAELIGAGAARTAVDGNGLDRVFHILPGAEVMIDGLTVGGGGSPSYTGDGAGILNEGKLTLLAVIISDNQAGENGGEGGGVANAGDMVIVSSSIHHNQSDLPGGGISNQGSLRIEDSAIFDNSALFAGGGISNSADLAIVSSTIASNGVENDGGGIFNSGDLSLESCTVAENLAVTSSGGHQGGGIFNAGRARLLNTILANNIAAGGRDCYGTLESLGHNLIGDLVGCGFVPLASDRIGDPGIGSLASRETPGAAHIPLLAWSPAIDGGDPASCSPEDQTGQPRADGNGDGKLVCDIGAVEFRDSCDSETVLEAGGPSSTFHGTWKLSEAPGFHGANSYWSKAGNSCVLRSSLSRGTYEVYEWHTIWPSRTAQARHEVIRTGDLTELYIDQSKGGGRWNSLGLYSFSGEPGQPAPAEVRIFADDRTLSTNADAVRFVCRSLEPPVAVIDDVAPQRAGAGQNVCLSGHGAGSPPFLGFEWISSIDGLLSTDDGFCTRTLSVGTHTISFLVRDASGSWSPPSIVRVPVEPASCTTDVIVDAGGAGTTLRGSWRPSESPGFYRTGSLWSKYSGSGSFPSATLSADLPPGEYEVFEWHTVWSTRTRAARHVIQHAGGSTTLNVDQSVSGGRWNRLGVFTFSGPGSVSIQAVDRERSTNADAVRFKCKT